MNISQLISEMDDRIVSTEDRISSNQEFRKRFNATEPSFHAIGATIDTLKCKVEELKEIRSKLPYVTSLS